MIYRIEIGLKDGVPDARGRGVIHRAEGALKMAIDECRTRDVYKVVASIDADTAAVVQKTFADPVVAESAMDRLPAPVNFDWMLEIGFKPGVTDNIGRTARGALKDIVGRELEWEEQVYTCMQYFLSGDLSRADVDRLGKDLLANTLIQTIAVFSAAEWQATAPDVSAPIFDDHPEIKVNVVELPDDDAALMKISSEGILSLSLEEMHTIRNHYLRDDVKAHRAELDLPEWPTDIELECIAQTWSEHCSHKVFAGTINYKDEETGEEETIHSLYKTYVKASTKKIEESIDWLISVFTDNAGIVKFNEDIHLVYKVETHNSPSALDPFGGSMTGIVGVNRDPLGTGMGAALVSNVWGYCLGSPFYDKAIPEGLMHPRRIRDGVHEGVIAGGNESGIPYSRGFECFDERFLGKPLVYCGTMGTIPVTVTGGPSERKEIEIGDWTVMCGGRIGKDGIHGATFSSEELRTESPAQAVQIGDPLTQRKLYEFILEARDLGLFRCITDNGAGGISCSFGEMGKYSGGCECDLAGAPLKYEGLQPWEVLVSEAQERMTLAVQPECREKFEALAKQRDVEVAFMGTYNDSGYFTVKQDGKVIASLDMDFLYETGCPTLVMPGTWKKPVVEAPAVEAKADYSETLTKLMGDLNLCSREYKSRIYDGEVKGLSVVKPYVGVNSDVPSDATVMRVEYNNDRGAVLAEGINPWYSDIDTYDMTTSVIDEAVRRVIAVGGDMNRIAILDNYCWPDPVESDKTPDGAYKMAQLVRSNKALYDLTTAYKTPAVSGKDSCKNDSSRGGKKISIPPTLLVSSIGQIDDVKKAVTMPLKDAGDVIYVIGETKDELGASAYYRLLAEEQGVPMNYGGTVPAVDADKALKIYAAMNKATDAGLLKSATTPSKGGLAVSLALTTIGGQLGADVDLSGLGVDSSTALFSESNSRFVVSVAPEKAAELEALFAGLPIAKVGTVTADKTLKIAGAVEANLDALVQPFKSTLHGV
ncbi:AIR synthase-related protein [Pontiella sulfatireligans]|uniref:Phosphoribosylformylglycinamidine synthase subunit PurL n=1 Tax=Pontiella sulfatireligans TaxID=2750658 RepID=A0A6C2UK71_9BACT|nr:AIR synthase-related protein [Pontiella sulfatireligans]VGO20630.1 Phosphoribosylformylglycinamidine synthase subunit PurL [Pontiella sulfatireligans]